MKKLPFCLLFAASLLVCGSAYSQENDTKAETEDVEDEALAPVVKPTSPWKAEFMLRFTKIEKIISFLLNHIKLL